MASSPQAIDNNDFLKINDVANILQLSSTTVWRHIRSGKIKAVKIGRSYRIRRSDFEAMLMESQVEPVMSSDQPIELLNESIDVGTQVEA